MTSPSDDSVTPDAPALTFADLGLPDVVVATLTELGFKAPTPIQAAAIPVLLAGRDLIGRARTGSGKTAAFGLPMMIRVAASLKAKPGGPGVRALVLAPTRELALQVTDALRQLGDGLGLKMLTVYGGASYGPQLAGLSRRVPIVVGTPGRLIDLLDKGALDLSAVESFVFDEADEMLAMGFVDEALRLLGETPPDRQVALLSATMPAPIRRIAENWLNDPVVVQTDGGRPAVDHIHQRWMAVPQQHKAEALVRLLRAEPPVATLVFLRTRAGCDEVVATLSSAGIDALALHGDLTQPAREQVLAKLRDERVRVVVATDVAARGLDVEHLGHVVNLDLPDNAEVYTHRIGRTGRAGRPGMATTLVPSGHWRRFLSFAQHLRADVEEIRPPSNAAISALQRESLFEAVMAPASDESDEKEDFDAERLAVVRRWVDELMEARGVDAHEIAARAVLQLAEERSVAVLADADRTLPYWATSGHGPRNILAGRLDGGGRMSRSDDDEPQHGARPHTRAAPVAAAPRPTPAKAAPVKAAATKTAKVKATTAKTAPAQDAPAQDEAAWENAGPGNAAPAQAAPTQAAPSKVRHYNDERPPQGRRDRTDDYGHQDRDGSDDGGRPDRRSAQAGFGGPGGFHESDVDHIELFIPVGENRRVTPADLVGAIAHAGDIPGRAIGKIRILERVSFVGLPSALADQVIERAETLLIRGMKVAVLRARPSGTDDRPVLNKPGKGKPPWR